MENHTACKHLAFHIIPTTEDQHCRDGSEAKVCWEDRGVRICSLRNELFKGQQQSPALEQPLILPCQVSSCLLLGEWGVTGAQHSEGIHRPLQESLRTQVQSFPWILCPVSHPICRIWPNAFSNIHTGFGRQYHSHSFLRHTHASLTKYMQNSTENVRRSFW